MKDKDLLRLRQIEETVKPFRKVALRAVPHGGWLRAIREALGMTTSQLARRLGKVPQTIDDIQKSEVVGTIQLKTLRELADALGCQLVYAIVPLRPLSEVRREQARKKAQKNLRAVFHSMRIEDQGLSEKEEKGQLEIQMQRLLVADPKKLWE